MPAYVATADIYNVLSSKLVAQLTDDTNGTTVDTDKVDSALDRAEGVVNSYVGKQYDVPLDTPVSGDIVHAVLTLSVCYLYRRRPGALPAEAKEACKDVMEWLEKVASGELPLDTVTADADDAADSETDDQVFTVQPF